MCFNYWNNRLPQRSFGKRLPKGFSRMLILKMKSKLQNLKWWIENGENGENKMKFANLEMADRILEKIGRFRENLKKLLYSIL